MKIKTGTVIFVIKNGKILLAKKTRVLGIGKWNGYGGGFDPKVDKTQEDCAVREFQEESNGAKIKKEFLDKVAVITFHNGNVLEFTVHFYIANNIIGMPKTSDEMNDPTWFPLDKLPDWDQFMESDKIWMPRILEGEKIKGDVWNRDDFSLIAHNINTVESF